MYIYILWWHLLRLVWLTWSSGRVFSMQVCLAPQLLATVTAFTVEPPWIGTMFTGGIPFNSSILVTLSTASSRSHSKEMCWFNVVIIIICQLHFRSVVWLFTDVCNNLFVTGTHYPKKGLRVNHFNIVPNSEILFIPISPPRWCTKYDWIIWHQFRFLVIEFISHREYAFSYCRNG